MRLVAIALLYALGCGGGAPKQAILPPPSCAVQRPYVPAATPPAAPVTATAPPAPAKAGAR